MVTASLLPAPRPSMGVALILTLMAACCCASMRVAQRAHRILCASSADTVLD